MNFPRRKWRKFQSFRIIPYRQLTISCDGQAGKISDLENYQQLVVVIECSITQLKHEGLHNESTQQLLQKLDGIDLDEKAKTLEMQIIAYIDAHHGDATPTQARLVSSDVIESIFDQYKQVGHSACL